MNITNKIYKLYKHTCPNGKVYIGITMLNINDRWRGGNGYKNNKYFKRSIDKYGWDNIKHEILFDLLTKEEAEKLEIEKIIEYNSNNKNFGYNINSGGESGNCGIKRSEETKEKIRKANLGKVLKESTKFKISKSLKGRIFTEEHRKRKSNSQTGIKNHRYGTKASEETKNKMRNSQPKGINNKFSVKVVQIDIKRNNTIKIWNSMGDIKRELGFAHCGISDCCRGKQKTAYGYIWKYYSDLYLKKEVQ